LFCSGQLFCRRNIWLPPLRQAVALHCLALRCLR